VPALFARARFSPAIAAVILITSTLLPPAADYARQYAFAQALPFVIFAVAGPALLVLAVPWPARLARQPGGPHPGRPAARAAIRLIAFVAVAVTWRLPITVNALVRDPALIAAETITLLVAGTGAWAELAGPRAAPGQLPPPARAVMAAAAMWTLWVLAYLTGMSGTAWFAAYRHGAPGGLSAAADQQIAAAIMWAVPAACFLPVLFVMVIAWLGGTASAGDMRPAAPTGTPGTVARAPRGWRPPNTDDHLRAVHPAPGRRAGPW